MDNRKRFLCILLVVALGGCVAVKRADEAFRPVVKSAPAYVSTPFALGERLTYDAYYGLIRAGTVTFVIEDMVTVCGRETYHVVLTAKTTPAFSKILHVDDRIETFIDREKFIPWRFAKVLNEGDYRCDEDTILDQENHVGHYRSNRSGYTKDYELPENCQDTLSIFCFLRLWSYSVGDRFPVEVMADEEIWDVGIEVNERARKTIYRGGSYNTFLLVADVGFDSGSLRKGRSRVWITEDRRKLIVCVKTKLGFGYLTLALVRVDNIREFPEAPREGESRFGYAAME